MNPRPIGHIDGSRFDTGPARAALERLPGWAQNEGHADREGDEDRDRPGAASRSAPRLGPVAGEGGLLFWVDIPDMLWRFGAQEDGRFHHKVTKGHKEDRREGSVNQKTENTRGRQSRENRVFNFCPSRCWFCLCVLCVSVVNTLLSSAFLLGRV